MEILSAAQLAYIETVRAKLGARAPKGTRRRAAAEIGVSSTALGDFIDGRTGPPREDVLKLYVDWLDGRAVRPVGEGAPRGKATGDPDEEFWIRYDAIEGRSDLSNEEKDRKADILAASIRAMAYRWDAKASEMRMRAMGTERTRRAEPPSGVNPPTRNARTVAPSGQPTRRKTGSGSI